MDIEQSCAMSLPKISIITPSLNQGAFLEMAIQSVLNQDYPNVEYLILDGGSVDESVQIIRKYADRLTFWCSEADRGQVHALNKGLRRATGDIRAYLCSDDYYLPGAFRAVAEAFARFPDKKWLAGNCKYVQADGGESIWRAELPGEDRVRLVCGPWGVPQPANFWRRELFDTYGLFREELEYVMDTEFQVRLALSGEMPIITETLLACARLHPNSKSVKLRHMQLREQGLFLEFFYQQLTPEERLQSRIEFCFREAGVAHKLGNPATTQSLLFLKGLIKAVPISPKRALKRLLRAAWHLSGKVQSRV